MSELQKRQVRAGYSVTMPDNTVIEGPGEIGLPGDAIAALEYLLEPEPEGEEKKARGRPKKEATDPSNPDVPPAA